MSTSKVTNIEHENTTNGGIQLDSSGHVTVDGQQLPTSGALSHRNLVINGDMRAAQRSTSETGVGGAFVYTTVDRFMLRNTGTTTARYTNTQSTDAPDSFGYSYKLETTTAKGTLSATNYQGVSTRLEGQNLQNLGYGTNSSKYLTLSFWVKSSTTGQYSCHFSNWNGGRNISKTYTINSANTWEQKSITIPGDSTAIANDNALGMEIGWVLASGSFYNDGTDGSTWHNTSDSGKRHSGQSVEFGGTIGDTWYLTGVQLEVGEKATPFEHRSYGDELARCQRYFVALHDPPLRGVFGTTTVVNRCVTSLPTTMRQNPTYTTTGTYDIYDGASIGTVTTFSASYTTTNSVEFDATVASGTYTAGNPACFYVHTSTNQLNVDAEL